MHTKLWIKFNFIPCTVPTWDVHRLCFVKIFSKHVRCCMSSATTTTYWPDFYHVQISFESLSRHIFKHILFYFSCLFTSSVQKGSCWVFVCVLFRCSTVNHVNVFESGSKESSIIKSFPHALFEFRIKWSEKLNLT